MKIILSHPTGNSFVRSLAKEFLDAEMLAAFYTSIAVFQGSYLDKIAHYKAFAELKRRGYDLPLKQYTQTFPFFELGRIVSAKIGASRLVTHENGLFSVDSSYHAFDKFVARKIKNKTFKKLQGVYAYEDGALETFLSAKALNIKCVYDLPIAYWETARKLMSEEAIRLPNWRHTLAGGVLDSAEKLERKVKELDLADMVIVPSKFVADSMPEWAQNKKVVMVPFGTPPGGDDVNLSKGEKKKLNRPLRVMFAGSMGQRKGLGDLFAAIKLLKGVNVELVVMGSLLAPMDFYKKELPAFIYEKGRPHAEVLSLMSTCDVFCLPSIVEGRALVMQEAMSRGLPIIITPNTGGDDLVVKNETGFLVPIRSPEIIAEKINWFAENRADIAEMGEMAKKHAYKYKWENYGQQIVNSINGLLG